MHKQISDRKVAVNQSKARKSTGPKTVAGKGRASLNSFKHGAYTKLDIRHCEIMLRGGEDITKGDGEGSAEEVIGGKMAQKDRTNQVSYLESIS
jgi:hypothetical protein